MKNFEERLRRLEQLSERIREPEIALEDAVAMFEEGVKLSKGLEKDLDTIEARVEILLNQPEGPKDKPELGLFDSNSGD
jgi:exodeoxyribonuclease VII small subunit